MTMHPLRVTIAIVGGASLGVAAVGSWYMVTPRMTVEAMAQAAMRGDGDQLAAYMDLPELRRDMRRRASSAIAQNYPPGVVVLNPDMVTEALVGKVIDQAFSVEGARRIVHGARRAVVTRDDVQYTILRDGPNHFVARLDSPRRVDLLFTRHAAGWLLSGIMPRSGKPPRLI